MVLEIMILKNARLEQERSEKDFYLKMLSHDVSTPLMTLQNAELPAVANLKEAHMLKKSVRSLLSTFESVKTLSVLSDKGESQKGSANLNDSIFEVLELCELHIKEKHLNVKTSLDQTIGLSVNIEKDVLVNSVLANIISNAIKFSYRNGDILISSSSDDKYVYVEVRDEGVGIDQKYINENLHSNKESQSGTEGEKGSGLGLSIVDKLLLLHDSTLELVSNSAAGTTVKIKLNKTLNENS